VEDGANGFLVDPDGDPHDVVEKLGRVAADPHAFDFMRHRARADVVSRFSLNSCAQKKVALYMSVRGSCDAVPKMEEIRSGQGVTGCA
jgi:glycosyltransferase involved in cell wall biosynthesis